MLTKELLQLECDVNKDYFYIKDLTKHLVIKVKNEVMTIDKKSFVIERI